MSGKLEPESGTKRGYILKEIRACIEAEIGERLEARLVRSGRWWASASGCGAAPSRAFSLRVARPVPAAQCAGFRRETKPAADTAPARNQAHCAGRCDSAIRWLV